MMETFLKVLPQAIQTAFLVLAFLLYTESQNRRSWSIALLCGVFSAFLTGFFISFLPLPGEFISSHRGWAFWRYLWETALLYAGMTAALLKGSHRPGPRISMMLFFIAGWGIFFFDARDAGFLVHDIGLMKDSTITAVTEGVAGLLTGFLPLLFIFPLRRKKTFQSVFTLQNLLVFGGVWMVAFGGIGGLEEGNLLTRLQQGTGELLSGLVSYIQEVLILSPHPFIRVPFTGVAGFLSGERMAMSLVVIFMFAPVLTVLTILFAKPDPQVHQIMVRAERRLQIAFFRKDLVAKSIPLLLSFFMLVVLLHASNISVNPLYDPPPMPVRAEGDPPLIFLHLKDRFGDFTDGRLRKYVYFRGNREVVFLAVLKPDGSVGVALDQCEVCRPAGWNKNAQGYAQRGSHLVCKYCMTPIALDSINNPGGCNPIPVPFRMEEDRIVIELQDLIRTFDTAEKMEKKGTHL
jgi:hypothetical protein